MLRTALEDRLRGDELEPGFVRPAYEDYCFANVPDTVLSIMGADADRRLPADVFDGVETDVDHVVVAFVDGFGWNHLRRVREDHPFLDRLARRATVTPLTSLFPSETAAAVTTFNTGTQPCEHGVLGWDTYVEELGGSIQALPFTDLAGEPLEDVLDDPDPSALVDEPPIYERIPGDACLVAPAGQSDGAYSRQVSTGAETVDYRNVAQGAYRVRERLESAEHRTYVYLYVPNVDTLAHHAGVAHPETDAQLATVLAALERELIQLLDDSVAERTLLLVTADHGEIDATPETTIALDPLGLDRHLRRGPDGEPIPAVGGPRNLQFYVRDGQRGALVERLESGLSALDPLVLTREQVLSEGLFGDREPSERFLRRCPDVLVVPRDGFAVQDDPEDAYVGMHGGLHEDEMLVPFAAARLDALRSR